MSTPVDQFDAAAMPLVEKTREHLARKLSLSTDHISIFSVEAVTWPDATLGCSPAKTMNTKPTSQAATPGYLILLEANGQTYSYHTDHTERVILCEIRGPGEIYNPP